LFEQLFLQKKLMYVVIVLIRL